MNWLTRQMKVRPHEVAVRFEEAQVTWSDLGRRTQRIAAALQLAGMRPGARVATLVHNGVDLVCLLHAAMWTGTTLVPLDPSALDAVVSQQLRDSAADLLVIDRSAANRSVDLGAVRFVQIEELTYSLSADPVRFRADDVATIPHTTSAAGPARPVRLTWKNYEAVALGSALTLGVRRDDDWLCCLSMSDVAGISMALRSVIYGTRLTVLPKFDAAAVFRAIEEGSRIVWLTPSMLSELADHAGGMEGLAARMLGSPLRAVLVEGTIREPMLADGIMAGLPIYQTYGTAETAGQIATVVPDRASEKIGSAGFPLWGAELSIRDEAGEPVPSGAGHVWVRGPMVSSGYLDRPELNRRTFVGGWFRTADRGSLDEDGFLWLQDPVEHVLRLETVSHDEIERALLGHPQIRDVAVFAVEDPRFGQRMTAAIVTDGSVSSEDLDAFARRALPQEQRPRAWVVVSELPRSETGSVRRQLLRARYG